MRTQFFVPIFVAIALFVGLGLRWPWFFAPAALFVALALIGVHDVTQRRRAVLRNFPIIGHFRYLLEMIRPEINQYFIESNTDGTPFNREMRSLVYQRAKQELDTMPFGTQHDVYQLGYEWIDHSFLARPASESEHRVVIGEDSCDKPYSSSLLNISAMSFGSLSSNAVLALNKGAKLGGFAHNTGEGGISDYHLEHGGDLIWQVGTGYFGCCDAQGGFDADRFQESARKSSVKMIEVKLSQGAKPGHGGILPAVKLTEEIARIRGVSMGRDVLSPPAHSAFSTPGELLRFLTDLRKRSGGKPVGIKFCLGRKTDFMALCKAMQETGLRPDFVTVDGAEGGTGAAPVEFSNSVGTPLNDGLAYVHNCLVGFNLREHIRVIASGKVLSGFTIASKLALGADLCASARAMMMAIGCIQARRCNSNDCPVGVATQKPGLVAGLEVESKAVRVKNFHSETIGAFLELLGAAGLSDPSGLHAGLINRRVSPTEVKSYAEIYPYLDPGALLADPVPDPYNGIWNAVDADSFVTL